ncbi:DUF2264 domain-containing protein [Halalkalibacterium halodurans]|uniref:DUF2264 domain-containing protein n=1 Tax=Halalkalibacterium halodurans TaxID=86665 RepID=UPI002E1D85B1
MGMVMSTEAVAIETRDDLSGLLKRIFEPVKPYYSEGFARLHFGNTGAAYPEAVAGFEGFSRMLWGLVPLLASSDETYALWERHLQGIKHGTNPQHPEYWGDVTDYDQRAVEMAAFGLALLLIPEKVWEPLSSEEKEHLSRWLAKINNVKVCDCNWLFFPVLVNLGLKRVGQPYDQQTIDENLARIEQFYVGNGWYTDGAGGHSDYYVPFAIHFYGLVYAKVMENNDPVRSASYKARAVEFAQDFIYWFAADGPAIPYGRSLTYRFAQASFWSAAVFAGIQPFSLGEMKGLIFRHLRWWFQQSIFDSKGLLTIGYTYPNMVMAENYNAPGSPYWALKTFLPLALDKDHPFWQAEEEPLPVLQKQAVQTEPHMVICRDERGQHVVAFNSGHPSSNEHTHTSAKYEKFAYSTVFGFSVPRAEWGLGQGAFDSMLALSEGDNLYRVKRYGEESSVHDQFLYAKWHPWQDVEVKTWIVPGVPWHVRIHRIETSRVLDAADGGFALGLEHGETELLPDATRCVARGVTAASGIVNLYGEGKTELIVPNANTNVLHPRTVIPTVKSRVNRGTTMLVSAVYGEVGDDCSWATVPTVQVMGETIIVSFPNRVPIEVNLGAINGE